VSHAHDKPFDTGRPRPIVTALDTMRRRIDHDAFDAAVLSLDAVVADLGYGDVRGLPGSVAWIDRLRGEGKRIGVVAGDERASTALDLAGLDDRIDIVVTGWNAQHRLVHVLQELGVDAERAIVMGTEPEDLEAARAAGVTLTIGVARGGATPEQLRRAGAVAIVADPQELLGVTSG
jgi:phosphoglycolate phosphatase-like HAD superfamily hydrolase